MNDAVIVALDVATGDEALAVVEEPTGPAALHAAIQGLRDT